MSGSAVWTVLMGTWYESPGLTAARYFVPPSFPSKRSRPIRVTTVISSNDEGQTGDAALTSRRCLAATFCLMIARLHCSTNSR